MKKVNFFAMLAAAALMTGVTGCSNDDNVGEGPGNGDATLVIKLPSNVVPGSRAVEDPVAGGSDVKTALNSVTVFLLNGNSVVSRDEFDNDEITAGYKRLEQVSATINRVILIANASSTDKIAFEGYGNASVILSHAYSTASQNVSNDGIKNKVLVGDATTTGGTDPGTSDPNHESGHTYMEADVTLDAITARFEIGAVKAGTGVAEVELLGVWINKFYEDGSLANVTNEGSDASYWNTTPSTFAGGGSFTDVDWGNSVTVPAWVDPVYYDDASDDVEIDVDSKVYAYQVFAGENIPQLILLVRGKYATGYFNDASDEYFFGYVTFTKFIEGSTEIGKVEANTIYKIGVGTTGIVITPDIITPKPNLEDIDLGINVLVTPWTEKTVTPGV